MIIDAFKNKVFPKISTGFEDDVDEEELLKRHRDKINRLPSKKSELPTIPEESSESEGEDKIPDISILEQIAELDKFYGSDLINKYFIENSLIKFINKLKD